MPYCKNKELLDMNVRELHRLRGENAWIIGIHAKQYIHGSHTLFNNHYREYCSLLTFINDINLIQKISTIDILGFYSYQLSMSERSVIHLETMNHFDTLDKQLMDYTGDTFSTEKFYNEDENIATSNGLIIHKKTKMHFFIPPLPMQKIS